MRDRNRERNLASSFVTALALLVGIGLLIGIVFTMTDSSVYDETTIEPAPEATAFSIAQRHQMSKRKSYRERTRGKGVHYELTPEQEAAQSVTQFEQDDRTATENETVDLVQQAIGMGATAEPEKARELLLQALEENPENVEALNELGMLHLDAFNDPIAAKSFFERSASIDPNQFVLSDLVGIYLDTEDLGSGKSFFGTLLDRNPENGDIAYAMGDLMVMAGDTEGAIKHFETAARFGKDRSDAYHSLGMTYLEVGRPDKAVSALESALEHEREKAERLIIDGVDREDAMRAVYETRLSLVEAMIEARDFDQAKAILDEVTPHLPADHPMISRLQEWVQKRG